VRIIAPGAANTPQVVTVFLEVLPAGSDPGALVAPQELVFNATVGADPPGAQSLLVYSIGAGSKTYVTGRPQDSAYWSRRAKACWIRASRRAW